MTQTTPPASQLTAGEAVAELRVAITRLARLLRASSPGGLTQSQWSALATVEAHQPVRLGDIADREGVSAPTATRLVASLESVGLVDREVDQADRRSAHVSLTDAGRAKIDWARQVRNAKLAERLASLPPDDVERLLDCLPLLEQLTAGD